MGESISTECSKDLFNTGQWLLHCKYSMVTTALGHFGIHSELTDEFTRKRKQKHELDNARKVLLKCKKRRLITKYGQFPTRLLLW